MKAGAEAGYGARYAISPVEQSAALTRAEQSARRAALLMPGSGLPVASLAAISSIRLDFASAVRGLQQAIGSNSYDGNVLLSVIFPLAMLGDTSQALQLADRAIGLDPFNPDAYFLRGFCLFVMRRYADAIAAFGKALALSPQRARPRIWIGFCQTLLNRPSDARAALVAVPDDNPYRLASEALIAARVGDRAGAYDPIAILRGQGGDSMSYQYGQIYAQLGDTDHAFAALDKAIEIRDAGLQFLKRDPFFDPIRRDPRFGSLLKQLKFPG